MIVVACLGYLALGTIILMLAGGWLRLGPKNKSGAETPPKRGDKKNGQLEEFVENGSPSSR